jgi:hypothetical protein
VLKKDETAAGQTYKYARVTKVHVGTDGKVRAADIEYKIPGEARFRSTTRLIHKLVLVAPVEEQTDEEDEGGEAGLEPENGDQYGGGDGGAQEEEDNRKTEIGITEADEQLPLGEAARGSEEEAQYEESDPQPIGETCPALPGVRVSDGLEEIIDVEAALRRGRGRPKKSKHVGQPVQRDTDPQDPHKGSVTDGMEGVCVDPGEKGAILEAGGAGLPGGGKGGQLASDSGGG